ncbi:MAG TPA: hypothetical protein VJP80_04680 [Candidatus Saccharimonadales bacterium]|nr:hypothetical protein [Candidatus Saccharimonadales bacterium]
MSDAKPVQKVVLPQANTSQAIKMDRVGSVRLPKPNLTQPIRKGI